MENLKEDATSTEVETGDPAVKKFIVTQQDDKGNPVKIEALIFYLDDKDNPIAKEEATKVRIIETDQNGETRFTYGTCTPTKRNVIRPKSQLH
jgi:hypothetical protein